MSDDSPSPPRVRALNASSILFSGGDHQDSNYTNNLNSNASTAVMLSQSSGPHHSNDSPLRSARHTHTLMSNNSERSVPDPAAPGVLVTSGSTVANPDDVATATTTGHSSSSAVTRATDNHESSLFAAYDASNNNNNNVVNSSVRTSIRSLDMGALLAPMHRRNESASSNEGDDPFELGDDYQQHSQQRHNNNNNIGNDDHTNSANIDDDYAALTPSASRGSYYGRSGRCSVGVGGGGGGGGMMENQLSVATTSGAAGTGMSSSGRPESAAGLVAFLPANAGGNVGGTGGSSALNLDDEVSTMVSCATSSQAGMSLGQLPVNESGEFGNGNSMLDAPDAPTRRKQRSSSRTNEAEFRGWETFVEEEEEDGDTMNGSDDHGDGGGVAIAEARRLAAERDKAKRLEAVLQRFGASATAAAAAAHHPSSAALANGSFGARDVSAAADDDGPLLDNSSMATQPPEVFLSVASTSNMGGCTGSGNFMSPTLNSSSASNSNGNNDGSNKNGRGDGEEDEVLQSSVSVLNPAALLLSRSTGNDDGDDPDAEIHDTQMYHSPRVTEPPSSINARSGSRARRLHRRDHQITVMSYNLLAQRYATSDKYGQHCAAHALETNYRVANIGRQIASIQPHIVLLQELGSALADDGSILRDELDRCGITELEFIPVTTPDGTDRIDALKTASSSASASSAPLQSSSSSLSTAPGAGAGAGGDDGKRRGASSSPDGSPTHQDSNNNSSSTDLAPTSHPAEQQRQPRRKTCSALAHIEGVGIGWNPNRFQFVDKRIVRFNRLVDAIPNLSAAERSVLQKPSHNVSCIVALHDLSYDVDSSSSSSSSSSDETIIVVGTIHAYYDNTRRECQLWQMVKLIDELQRFRDDLLANNGGRNRRVHIILGGDFNCELDFYPMQYVETGRVNVPDISACLAQLTAAAGEYYAVSSGGASEADVQSLYPGVATTQITANNSSTTGTPRQEISSGAFSVDSGSSAGIALHQKRHSIQSASGMGSAEISAFDHFSQQQQQQQQPPHVMLSAAAAMSRMASHTPAGFSSSSGAGASMNSHPSESAFGGAAPPTPSKSNSKHRHRRMLSNMTKPVQAPTVLRDVQDATHSLQLSSCYKEYHRRYPKHITVNDASTDFSGCIDHIFHQPEAFRVMKVGKIFRKVFAVPNEKDPSDHAPVAVVLEPLFS